MKFEMKVKHTLVSARASKVYTNISNIPIIFYHFLLGVNEPTFDRQPYLFIVIRVYTKVKI